MCLVYTITHRDFTACNSGCGKVMFSQACVKKGVSHDTHPCADTPPVKTPTRQTPPPPDTTGYGQQVGGTHRTGMHSCFHCY